MENLLKELAWKCFENELHMTIYSHGSIDITHHYEYDRLNSGCVTAGILKGYENFEKPIDALKRMHREVDEFLEERENE